MTVSIPAGSAVGFQAADAAHPIFFALGDAYDLRIDDATDASGATITLSASLEEAT